MYGTIFCDSPSPVTTLVWVYYFKEFNKFIFKGLLFNGLVSKMQGDHNWKYVQLGGNNTLEK